MRRCLSLAALLIGATAAAGQQPTRAPTPRAVTSQAPLARPGGFDAIERERYEAVRRAPRSAEARLALGAWLASRGQLRSGAVLLEEARLFGADAYVTAARLAPVYRWLRDWVRLEALPASTLSAGERAVASYLVEHGGVTEGSDTTVVPFAPMEIGALGRVPLVLGNDTVWAEVDPQETGVVLPGLGRGAGLVQLLGDDRRGPVGVLSAGALGELTLHNVPVRIDTLLGRGRAKLGFDLFAALAPTVDARAGLVTLRRDGRVGEGQTGVPLLLDFPGVRLLVRDGEMPASITSPAGRAALRGTRWTVDVRRGTIWRERAP